MIFIQSIIRKCRYILAIVALCCLTLTPARAAGHAVILAYHHVGDDTPASTSVTVETFAGHLSYLHSRGFHVLPLQQLLEKLSGGEELPEKSVSITFDDAYISVYTTAMPMLREHGWPFTVFVNTEPVEKGYGNFMNWQQLRELQANGGAVANHSHSHAYMVRRARGESEDQWGQRMRHEIQSAQAILNERLGPVEKIFAYPYGEFSGPLQAIVSQLGFFGIGQHSGAVGFASDWTAVPRFPMAAGFAGLDQFATKVNSRPLPVEVLLPDRRLLSASDEAPVMRFRLGEGDFRADELNCYCSGNKMAVQWLDRKQRLLEIRPDKPVGKGRIKYNCTAPSASQSGVYYWYSHLLIRR